MYKIHKRFLPYFDVSEMSWRQESKFNSKGRRVKQLSSFQSFYFLRVKVIPRWISSLFIEPLTIKNNIRELVITRPVVANNCPALISCIENRARITVCIYCSRAKKTSSLGCLATLARAGCCEQVYLRVNARQPLRLRNRQYIKSIVR